MQKRAPTLANILVIVLFALSCFGLLLFLWESFGGPVPLKPKGYRVTVDLPRTLALAEQSDVRISGVNVGHVVELHPHLNGLTHVTFEIAHQYAPIRADDHMILRQKTLLGETYIELLPTRRPGPALADEGSIPTSHVQSPVTLDDILSALDPRTRAAFKAWQQTLAASFNGRGEQINSGFSELEPFVEHANKLVTILASQQGALQAVVHNTGVVFDALTERDHQFRGFIVNGERTFHALAQSSQQFADAFRELPAFERNSQITLRALDSFAADASPLLDQLRPFERELTPLLHTVQAFTPDLNNVLTGIGPLTSASKKGLPALEQTLDLLPPLLGQSSPVLRNLDPFLQFTSGYIPEIQALLGNATAATQAHDNNADLPVGTIQHYLRILPTITPESLAAYNQRIGTNRANPYFQSGALRLLGSGGLPVFSSSNCADSAPFVSGPPNAAVSQEIIEQLQGTIPSSDPKIPPGHESPVANDPAGSGNSVAAPSCNQQNPFTWEGQTSQYPRVTAPSK